MIGNKIQPYKYSLVTSAHATDFDIIYPALVGTRYFFYIVPPENSLTIENINTKFVFQFFESIPIADRYIDKIGICNTIEADPYADPSYIRYFDVNIQADSNRVVEFDIDLTSLLKKDNVEYMFNNIDYPDNGTFIFIDLKRNIVTDLDYAGDILLWKTDALFTTIGIK